MRVVSAVMLLLAVSFRTDTVAAKRIWEQAGQQKGQPAITGGKYLLYTADKAMLYAQVNSTADDPQHAGQIALPMANGLLRTFSVKETPMMPASLAARYPELHTYTAIATDDPTVTAKLDMTLYGFHAMIFDNGHVSFVDPYDNTNSGYYVVHYKEDEQARAGATANICLVRKTAADQAEEAVTLASEKAARTVNGSQMRAYRLALSCDNEYAVAATGIANPTIAQTLSKMLTSMNRINGVYERELAVTMNFVANEDTLIWTLATGGINGGDSFSNINDDASACNLTNQDVCDNRIGSANYDIGHVFTTGAGGFSQVAVVCKISLKAQSSTGQPNPVGDGFDIDFVAHEMGHEFGGNHTFNNSADGSCAGDNWYGDVAYEPGSGSTIMAYAGICSPDDIQPHSDDYFHAASLIEIDNYLAGYGNTCAVKTTLDNSPVSVPSFSWSYNIPYLTPFELTAPTAGGTDTSVTYCWEEWDRSASGERLTDTHEYGPLFRSYAPVKDVTRVFPKISMVLSGILSNAGTEDAEGEKAPDVARDMTFKLGVRNIISGYGAFTIADDSISLHVINTLNGFKVTSQNTKGNIFNGNSTQHVTWDVVGTDNPPVNTPNVDVYMSADGGYTWPYHIGTYINNGAADVTLPNPDTTISYARIKVKGTDNVFFNVNSENFTVIHSDAGDTDISMRPVPAHTVMRISSGNKGLLQTHIYDAAGRQTWIGQVNGDLDLAISNWARGMYFVRFVDVKGRKTIKKFVVE